MSADPYYVDDRDAIVTAALCGDYEVVCRLVNAGGDVNIRDDMGRTALMVAADETYSAIVQYLLEHRADPNIADNDGDTPLDVARYSSLFRVHRDSEIVDMLTAHGAKGRDGPSAMEERDDQIYEAFEKASEVKRAGTRIPKKKDS